MYMYVDYIIKQKNKNKKKKKKTSTDQCRFMIPYSNIYISSAIS